MRFQQFTISTISITIILLHSCVGQKDLKILNCIVKTLPNKAPECEVVGAQSPLMLNLGNLL